jgi:hypothetical protein
VAGSSRVVEDPRKARGRRYQILRTPRSGVPESSRGSKLQRARRRPHRRTSSGPPEGARLNLNLFTPERGDRMRSYQRARSLVRRRPPPADVVGKRAAQPSPSEPALSEPRRSWQGQHLS